MSKEVLLEFVKMINDYPTAQPTARSGYENEIRDPELHILYKGEINPMHGRASKQYRIPEREQEKKRKQMNDRMNNRMNNRTHRQRIRCKRIRRILMLITFLVAMVCMTKWFIGILWDNVGMKELVNSFADQQKQGVVGNGIPHPQWTESFLTKNPYSRPGETLTEVKDIFVHYTANPGTNAVQNRSYFEQLKDTHERCASSHFIIGYEGDIILCVPPDEVAYAVKTRNYDSMSIECCYINEDGSFTKETYDALIELLAWLLKEYNLSTDNILRHYDCGGKKCPLYYVENEEEWQKLKLDVEKKLSEE